MRKTFFTLIALLLSLTTVNAQMLTPDGSITVTKQRTAVINKHMAPAMGPNRIAMDADERIMGYYDSDEMGTNALGLNGSGQFKAGVEVHQGTDRPLRGRTDNQSALRPRRAHRSI